MKNLKILAFAGSTRKDSYNKKLVKVMAELARETGASVELIDLADYRAPLYDGDFEEQHGLPEEAAELKRKLNESDALLISSPEYNGSLTAVLKNTIDWLSRPGAVEGSVFQGKTALLVSASPGGLGGLRGLRHLREILTNLGTMVVPGQRAVSAAHKVFGEDGQLNDEALKEQLAKLVEDFHKTATALL